MHAGTHHTIKSEQYFLVTDEDGFIPEHNRDGLGFYWQDTRFLSRYEIKLNQSPPQTLLSSLHSGVDALMVYTNHPTTATTFDRRTIQLPKETLTMRRECVLAEGLFERWTLTNFHPEPLTLQLDLILAMDFKDIFEVRGMDIPPIQAEVDFTQTDSSFTLRFAPHGDDLFSLTTHWAGFDTQIPPTLTFDGNQTVTLNTYVSLEPNSAHEINLSMIPCAEWQGPCEKLPATAQPINFKSAQSQAQQWHRRWYDSLASITTDNETANNIFERARHDLAMLMTPLAHTDTYGHTGEYHYIAAGVPWYVALFGRDSIITAHSCLMLNPDLAKDTLTLLALFQGKEHQPYKDEEPGKILHELRVGRLAREKSIPHYPYYGTVDATPLWLMLLHDYYLWTNDTLTLKKLWPNAKAALAWINKNLSSSSTGYLSYSSHGNGGLHHQGWKDSHDSAMYSTEGRYAEPPIVLCEVQSYVYGAKMAMAKLAKIMKEEDFAQHCETEAIQFKQRFNQDFWNEGLGTVNLALDADGNPVDVVTSNAGHCLATNILLPNYAQQVAERLMAPDMFNGWGIRTLSSQTWAYNPMSYHNGSVWPHDNALIARGMSACGYNAGALQVMDALYHLVAFSPYYRMPELICGFRRDTDHAHRPPVGYPVACSPQAWSAVSLFSLLQSVLNLAPVYTQEAPYRRLILKQPMLPETLKHLTIDALKIAGEPVRLEIFRKSGGKLMVEVDSPIIPVSLDY